MFRRWYAARLRRLLQRPYVHVLFGARQTGKSTLIRSLMPPDAFQVDLSDPEVRLRYASRPGDFVRECQGLPRRRTPHFVLVDEAQAVPAIFDAVQHLYDADRRRFRLVLCGSSARKLRQTGTNLLPGRSMIHRLYPLTLLEHPARSEDTHTPGSVLPLRWETQAETLPSFPPGDLIERLAVGELPGIVVAARGDREALLRSYAAAHLEEEIRREAQIRDWGAFVRFLQLAAIESGQVLNYAAVSQEAGISQPTVKAYYQLLEDLFVGFRIPAFSGSPRKHVLSTPRFVLFDLGVRHAAAGLRPSAETVRANPGPLFEQWVGIELWKRLQYLGEGGLSYFRTKDGAEVDFVVEHRGTVTPVEVKYTERPSGADASRLRAFLREQGPRARHGFVVCRCPRPMRLDDNVTALPWTCL